MALDSTQGAPCPAEDRLHLLLADALLLAERALLETHVESCPSCQRVLERLTSASLVEKLRPAPARAGEEVPGYDILARLGEGGMGVVYKARHRHLDRIVALKMARSGRRASAEELARFRTEAQAAARLQHPNIVQIYEVGEVDGQPFLCLEYVEGQSLDKLVKGAPWPAYPAAGLIETLARAIDAAHRQGIVHRDLKPANILMGRGTDRKDSPSEVTTLSDGQRSAAPWGEASPKIADFGLAKLLEGDQGQTQSGVFLGTPSYAAPEQVAAKRSGIGPHTDIYALGAILYELLTGRPPFCGAELLDTIQKVLRQEPVAPRLLNRAIPPDLEAICLKCLEKGPTRRYASAAALAEDLRRWQNHEPIQARRPGPLGRASRWCQRHPALTTIAAVIVLALLGVSWQWREAVRAGELADQRRQEAEAATVLARKAEQEAEQARKAAVEDAAVAREVANFLGGLFEQADPFVLTDRVLGEQPKTQPTALDIVDGGARRLAATDLLKARPLVRANLLDKVGHVYLSLGEGAKAAPFILEALELRRKHMPGPHPDLASSLHNVGFFHLTKGNFETSKGLFADALRMRTRLFGARSPQAMTSRFHLAFVRSMLGDASAEPLLLDVLAFQRKQLAAAEKKAPGQVGKEALECTFALVMLCNYYAITDQFARVLPYMVEANQVAKKIANKDVSDLTRHILGFRQQQALGLTGGAEKSLVRALKLLEKRVGGRHYLYLILQRDLAYLYFYSNRHEDAERAFLELEDNYRKTIGGDGAGLAEMSFATAIAIRHGKFAEALHNGDQAQRREQVARIERYALAAYSQGKQSGLNEDRLGVFVVLLAEVYCSMRPEPDYALAVKYAGEGVRIRNKLHGVGHPLTGHPRQYLLMALLRQGKIDEIEKHVSELLAGDPRPDLSPGDLVLDVTRALARAKKNRVAVLVLEQAIRLGHYDLARARSAPAFASLRESKEYRHLLAKLSK